jgi:hypothetical protein
MRVRLEGRTKAGTLADIGTPSVTWASPEAPTPSSANAEGHHVYADSRG